MTWMDPLSRYLHKHAGQHGPVMLMYHAIRLGKQVPEWPWAVSMEEFRRQLDFLTAEGYSTPTMGELLRSPALHKQRIAVITFDDGFADNLAACDELAMRGMRATWFLVSGSIGLEPRWPADGRPPGRLLDGAELRAMHRAGLEIGSHTVSHVRLPELDDESIRRELMDSKATLEQLLGSAVDSFAYPYGAWDARCAEAVEAAGYSAACTTRTGWALRDNNPYQLRRLTVFNTDTVSTLARKLYFGSHQVRWKDIAAYALRRLGNA